MKHLFVFCIGTLLSLMLTGCFTKASDTDNSELQQLVISYGEAVNSLTAESLKFGGDTETAWAIDTVNTIWTNCKAKPFDFLQYMTDIALMQSYFAYGVTYFPMVLYRSKYYAYISAGNETYSSYFDEAMGTIENMYPDVVKNKNELSYFIVHAYSLHMMDLYFAMTDDLYQNDISPRFAALQGLVFIGDLYENFNIQPADYAWLLDGTSFYITYSTWIRRTAQDPNEENRLATLTDYALIFDSYASPISKAMMEEKPLPAVTADDAHTFLIRTLPMRIDMIRMLEENFKQIK